MLQYFLHTGTQQARAQDQHVAKFNSLTEQFVETVLESLQDSWSLTAITAQTSRSLTLIHKKAFLNKQNILNWKQQHRDYTIVQNNTQRIFF